MEPDITDSESFRLTRSGKPPTLPGGFKILRHQQISDQESPSFPIPGMIWESNRIIGKEKHSFQLDAERFRPNDSAIVGSGEISTKEQQIIVNTSYDARSSQIRNYISTQSKNNVSNPESTISSIEP
ncbi:hypothetical protein O181_126706 [Austropuccinia psidii MF-1]|uniref:Uncharacterized protein n=1 Tax=Austropuccinia psidii MF-1 TaxID=1389203 RepID=A0A9Q3KVK4_9BASI|nr:hypothetical protein [Austropuccinia psidii MF-1]